MSIEIKSYLDKLYKVKDGTYYNIKTPDEVIEVLETARRNRTRIRIHYGYTEDKDDKKAGQDWYEENDVTGTIGRSMGPVKVPLMIERRSDYGGDAILTNCIVRIRTTTGKELYLHPNYRKGKVAIVPIEPHKLPNGKVLTVSVTIDEKEYAAFENKEQAVKWIKKMGLDSCLNLQHYAERQLSRLNHA